ncbi:MAG: hypothetical protein LBB45_05840 [Methanobrevibacter sp.]|jgi:hypothetical protein|nr:hypothetical protein [Candidatus Methanovirga basalitermitum]
MRKFFVLIFVFAVFFSAVSVQAKTISNDEVIVEVSEEDVNKANEEQIKLYLDKYNSIKETPTYEYKLEKVGSQTATKVRIGYAANQPKNGTVFASTGGFYWSDGGNEVSISISIGYGIFSLSVSPGKPASSGEYISAPVNKACKLVIHKDIEVIKYQLYRRPLVAGVGTGNWTYVEDSYTKTPVKHYLSVETL